MMRGRACVTAGLTWFSRGAPRYTRRTPRLRAETRSPRMPAQHARVTRSPALACAPTTAASPAKNNYATMFTHAEPLPNKNVDFLNDKHIGVAYVLGIVVLRFLLMLLPLENDMQWSMLHWIHTIFTFITFHHSKGSPDDNIMGQGKYGYLTWWEQIDNGKQFTLQRKILTVSPIILFLLVTHMTNWDSKHLLFNFLGLVLVLVPKFPGMHRLRPFGWNAGYY